VGMTRANAGGHGIASQTVAFSPLRIGIGGLNLRESMLSWSDTKKR
jgi:hypothetical protein